MPAVMGGWRGLEIQVFMKEMGVHAGNGGLLFGFPSHWELLIVGGIILLFFFGRRIPEVMRSLGKGVTQFKKGLREDGAAEEAGQDATAPAKVLPAPEKDAVVEGERKAEPAEAPSERDRG